MNKMKEELRKLFEDLQQCECGMLVDCELCNLHESSETYRLCRYSQFSPRVIAKRGLSIIENGGRDETT